ncbi:MAG: hypothetical protein ACRC1H_02155, partial [Caldilineaceae bacterium]
METAAPPRDRRRITIGRFFFLAMVVFLLGTCAVRVANLLRPSAVALGEAPNLTLTTFDGETISLAALRGQPV